MKGPRIEKIKYLIFLFKVKASLKMCCNVDLNQLYRVEISISDLSISTSKEKIDYETLPWWEYIQNI